MTEYRAYSYRMDTGVCGVLVVPPGKTLGELLQEVADKGVKLPVHLMPIPLVEAWVK
ncbi:MAG TPA: hypothetical protein VNR89_03995 [Roseomonas sp.]|nr:hypothetical protein [Roseomonas sp.]